VNTFQPATAGPGELAGDAAVDELTPAAEVAGGSARSGPAHPPVVMAITSRPARASSLRSIMAPMMRPGRPRVGVAPGLSGR
jgi:hypothetical protein